MNSNLKNVNNSNVTQNNTGQNLQIKNTRMNPLPSKCPFRTVCPNEKLSEIQISKKNQNKSIVENKENVALNRQSQIKSKQEESLKKDTIQVFPLHLYEYRDEMYCSLISDSKEQNYSQESILSIQGDINHKMRSVLIDWLIALHHYFPLSENTLFITVNIIDRYISKVPISRTKFQLLGVTSFFIASKYEDLYSPEPKCLAKMTAGATNAEEIIKFELEVLEQLDFKVSAPNQYDLYQFMSLKFKFNRREFFIGLFLLETFLLDLNTTKYSPLVLCDAACYLVLKINRKKVDINSIIVGNDKKETKRCVKEIFSFCKDITSSHYKYILYKFKEERYNKTVI